MALMIVNLVLTELLGRLVPVPPGLLAIANLATLVL
jgi:hypothetical protein